MDSQEECKSKMKRVNYLRGWDQGYKDAIVRARVALTELQNENRIISVIKMDEMLLRVLESK